MLESLMHIQIYFAISKLLIKFSITSLVHILKTIVFAEGYFLQHESKGIKWRINFIYHTAVNSVCFAPLSECVRRE